MFDGVDLNPLFYKFVTLIIWMCIPGFILAFTCRWLPEPLYNLVILFGLLGGMYGFFKYGI